MRSDVPTPGVGVSGALRPPGSGALPAVRRKGRARLETRAGSAFIPVTVLLPVDGPPTSDDKREKVRVEWRLRVQFPAGAAIATLVSAAVFVLAGFASLLPGPSWAPPAASGLSFAVAVVSRGLSAFMLLVLLMSLRILEVGPRTVRTTRGRFRLGFHCSLPARDVAEVVEEPSLLPNASPRFCGIALRMRDGALHGAAPRMRDSASARALAQLLASVLPPP